MLLQVVVAIKKLNMVEKYCCKKVEMETFHEYLA